MKRTLLAAAIFAVLALTPLVAGASGAATSNVGRAAFGAACAEAPGDAACTGRFPQLEGCTKDATTVASALFVAPRDDIDSAQRPIFSARLLLQYSARCQSFWAQVDSRLGSGITLNSVRVIRDEEDDFVTAGGLDSVTRMFFAPSHIGRATAVVALANGAIVEATTNKVEFPPAIRPA